MSFKEMSFRGQPVYVEVDADGELVLEGGRARMKYRLADERVYNPWPANLEPIRDPSRPAHAKSVGPARSSRASENDSVPLEAIVAFTDGACIGNPGPSGLGYWIAFPDGRRVSRGEPLGHGTNNIAELSAIERVFDVIGETAGPLLIYTDSEYAIGVLIRGWKAKANKEIIERVKRAMARFSRLELRKVRGHSGIAENEAVDQLARCAAETQKPVESA